MAWNSANPVAWKRLFIEWAVIGAAVAAVSLFVTDNRKGTSYFAIILGGVVYIGLGGVMAKFGYQRKTLKQIRAEAAAAPPRQIGRSPSPSGRPRPAPTSRTSGGTGKSSQKKKR
ncbi:MAG TPA: hypothetical protein PK020_04850 [Ilumatobacteraceae bacterium]|nr:hypothetical protein [Ilumatobacteraceae bacterium]HRB02845.1 hypothetical protein [Ilumatobacteraceae bacterium]